MSKCSHYVRFLVGMVLYLEEELEYPYLENIASAQNIPYFLCLKQVNIAIKLIFKKIIHNSNKDKYVTVRNRFKS